MKERVLLAILAAFLYPCVSFPDESPAPKPSWVLSYVPLVVTEGEPVTLIAKRQSGDTSPVFLLSSPDSKSTAPSLSIESRGPDEAVLRFTPPSHGSYSIQGSGLSASIRIVTSLKDLEQAKPVLHHLVNDDGSIPILFHSRRLVRETRDWYIVRKFLESVLPDELPPRTLAVIPQTAQSIGFSPLVKSLSTQNLAALTTLEIPSDGLSPLLTLICGLSRQIPQLAPARRSVIILLPPGEWNGGLPPDDYRRAVEWLLDRFISAGAARMLVAGPVGYGIAPARAAEYRSAASAAAASRMASYLSTDGLVQFDDLRASPSGPLTDIPNPNVQQRLAAAIADSLRKSPVIPSSAGY